MYCTVHIYLLPYSTSEPGKFDHGLVGREIRTADYHLTHHTRGTRFLSWTRDGLATWRHENFYR